MIKKTLITASLTLSLLIPLLGAGCASDQSVTSSATTSMKTYTKLMVALMQVDSSLGTKGKGARMNNPGNVGTWPGHDTSFRTWQEGVDAVAKFLDTHRVK
jgi:hypothetical protein